jgi:hypothetical protein
VLLRSLRIPARWIGASGLAWLAACGAPGPPATPPLGLSPELVPYLLDPGTHCGAASPVSAEALEAHRRLLLDGDAGRVETAVRARLAGAPDELGSRVVLVQALLAAGRAREAEQIAAFPPVDPAGCPALAVARGRALESLGDPAGAYDAYRRAGGDSGIAARRSAEIGDAARAAARAEFVAKLEKGHLEAAGWHLDRLELWWPRSEAALRSRLELASRTGDPERELTAARALQEAEPGDRALTLRRAELEIEVGDARAGLALIEGLAAAAPQDTELQGLLERARFEWRLLNAPESVRRLRRSPEISRADFATLIYWMTPPVRTARPAGGRIATDVLDHPAREEIVRLVNLGLMSVDETLHRFSPGAPMRRGDALRTLLRTIRFASISPACGGSGEARDLGCEAAVACGLIATPEDCLPGASISGREAVELLRRALEVAGGG